MLSVASVDRLKILRKQICNNLLELYRTWAKLDGGKTYYLLIKKLSV